MIENFEQLVAKARGGARRRVAVAGAQDAHTLEAVAGAGKDLALEAVLIGKRSLVEEELRGLSLTPGDFEIIDSRDENPGALAVQCVREGRADFLMKGGLDTKGLMKPVLDKEKGLAAGRVMSGFAIAQIPGYHKLIANADGAVLLYPTLGEKRDIIINSVEALRRLGVEHPKIAALCAVEKVSPKMPETVEAEALAEMSRRGELGNCTVIGPISYDLIMSRGSAAIKGFDQPYCGDFDMILSPNIATGNTLTKVWAYSANARWAGLILGARTPIVVVSRGSSAEEKFLSLVLAILTSPD